jgi:hypothetical protein
LNRRDADTGAWISQGGLWGDGYLGDYGREQPGQWPTPELLKREHLAAIHEELQRLKDEALDAKLQQEWDEYEQELPK